jgi:hypothetical protein
MSLWDVWVLLKCSLFLDTDVGCLMQSVSVQGFNNEKVDLSNFLKRMYNSSPFTGVKLVDDYDNNYIISVVSLSKEKYTNPSIMNRVAEVKSSSQASRFFNGSSISVDFVISTTEKNESGETEVKTIEAIKENSMGFVKGLELLTNFEENGFMIYIYYNKVE